MGNQKSILIKIPYTDKRKDIIMDEICFASHGGIAYVRTSKDLPEGHNPQAIIPAGTKCEIINWCEDEFGTLWMESNLWPAQRYKERVVSGDVPNDGRAYYVKFYSGMDGRIVHQSDLDLEFIEIEFGG